MQRKANMGLLTLCVILASVSSQFSTLISPSVKTCFSTSVSTRLSYMLGHIFSTSDACSACVAPMLAADRQTDRLDDRFLCGRKLHVTAGQSRSLRPSTNHQKLSHKRDVVYCEDCQSGISVQSNVKTQLQEKIPIGIENLERTPTLEGTGKPLDLLFAPSKCYFASRPANLQFGTPVIIFVH